MGELQMPGIPQPGFLQIPHNYTFVIYDIDIRFESFHPVSFKNKF